MSGDKQVSFEDCFERGRDTRVLERYTLSDGQLPQPATLVARNDVAVPIVGRYFPTKFVQECESKERRPYTITKFQHSNTRLSENFGCTDEPLAQKEQLVRAKFMASWARSEGCFLLLDLCNAFSYRPETLPESVCLGYVTSATRNGIGEITTVLLDTATVKRLIALHPSDEMSNPHPCAVRAVPVQVENLTNTDDNIKLTLLPWAAHWGPYNPSVSTDGSRVSVDGKANNDAETRSLVHLLSERLTALEARVRQLEAERMTRR